MGASSGVLAKPRNLEETMKMKGIAKITLAVARENSGTELHAKFRRPAPLTHLLQSASLPGTHNCAPEVN